MRNSNLQDFYQRMNYLKNESKIWFLKSIIFDSSSFLLDKVKAAFILNKKFRWFSKVRIINRCVISGWAKSVLRDFWLSWMEFKRFGSEGCLTGVKKRNF